MGNRILVENPFGTVSENDIRQFQENAGIRLPPDYIDYLAKYNGGNFERTIFDDFSAPYHDAVVHQMYGLHQGPKFARLQDNYKLHQHFDLKDYKDKLKHYFVFASTSTGDLLLLDLGRFSVHLFRHELVQDIPNIDLEHVMIKLAGSFNAFISALISQEDLGQKHKDSGMFNDFQERLRALKQARKQEVARFLGEMDT